jgi:hypothetical protein
VPAFYGAIERRASPASRYGDRPPGWTAPPQAENIPYEIACSGACSPDRLQPPGLLPQSVVVNQGDNVTAIGLILAALILGGAAVWAVSI